MVYGFIVYAHIKQVRTKGPEKYFIEYPEKVKGHKQWCFESGQFKYFTIENVILNE